MQRNNKGEREGKVEREGEREEKREREGEGGVAAGGEVRGRWGSQTERERHCCGQAHCNKIHVDK